MTENPITPAEMAGIIARTINAGMGAHVADSDGDVVVMMAPATGQVFRLAVAEVDGDALRLAEDVIP